MFEIFFFFLITIILPIIYMKFRTDYNIDRKFIFEFLSFIMIRLKNAKEYFMNYVYKNHTVKKDNIMKIIYYCDEEKYSVITPIVLGPRPIRRITNTNNEELFLSEFMGPYSNFHNIPTTPKMLGFDENIIVHYKNKKKIEYKCDEIIKINI